MDQDHKHSDEAFFQSLLKNREHPEKSSDGSEKGPYLGRTADGQLL